jgi:Mg/Co/Ni transporter MgtE
VIVGLLPHVQQRRVRALLGYDPATAGGLMSPEFVCIYRTATRTEALDRVRRSNTAADALAWVFLMNTHKRLEGAVALADLLRADEDAVSELAVAARSVRPDAGLEEVARLMTDFDLTVVPVVDDEQRMVGVITVDDVLELVLPRGWRRNFHVFGED